MGLVSFMRLLLLVVELSSTIAAPGLTK